MKRLQHVVLLCMAVVLFAVPSWGAGTFADLQTLISNDTTGKITLTQDYTNSGDEKAIVISKDIEIDGGNFTIDAQSKGRAITVSADSTTVTVTIKNLKVKNGKLSKTNNDLTECGGGIFVYNSNAVLENITFENNSADEGGGFAVRISEDKDANKTYTITVTSCDFIRNHGSQQAGGLRIRGSGGSITSVDIVGCTFTENSTGTDHGAGAMICTNYTTKLSDTLEAEHVKARVQNCTFTKNASKNGGGGLYLYSGCGPVSVDVVGCVFEDNTAGYLGGGIYNLGYEGFNLDVNVKDSVFKNNKATQGGGVANFTMNNSSSGDIIVNSTIENCTFVGNNATTGRGGGLFNWMYEGYQGANSANKINSTVLNCTFTGNTAKTYGGAIANRGTTKKEITQTITNCTFVDNKAEASNGGNEIWNITEATDGKSAVTINNSFFWNTSNDAYIINSADASATITFANSAYRSSAISSDATGITKGTSDKTLTSLGAQSEDVTLSYDGFKVTHTIFRITDEALKAATTVTRDQLGVTRASQSMIGAVEYVDTSKYKIVAKGSVVQSDGKTLSGDIKTSFDVTFLVSGDLNVDEVSVDWEASPTSIAGLTFANGKLSGTPTASADKSLTVTATNVTIKATGYVLAEKISGDFKVVITSADAAKSDETKTDDTTGKTTVKSPDLTVKITSTTLTIAAGSSADLTATVTSGDTAVSDATLTWKAKSTLPTGFTISGSKLVVASTVTPGDYTAGVVATAAKSGYNNGTTSADVKVTVTVTSSGTNTGGGSGTPATDTETEKKTTDGSTVTLDETNKTQVVVLATNGSIANLLNVLTEGYAIDTADGSAFAIKSTNAITATDLAKLLTYEFNVTLDLSDAPATITTVNLASAKMPELKISNNKNITSLTFTKNSQVPKVSARGSNVKTLDLAGNENITDLDIGETQVETVDFEGTKVENLSADNSESLSELKNINSCKTTLKTLGIDGCAIAFVDLNGFTALTNVQLGSQSPRGWGFRRRFSWFAFFFTYGGMTAPSDITESSDIGSRVTNIGAFDASGNELTVTSDDTGEVSINGDATAFNYEFDSKAQAASSDVSGGSLRASASNVNPAMNVQISGSTTGGDETIGGSGGGCDVGFGIAALMALAFFINKKH